MSGVLKQPRTSAEDSLKTPVNDVVSFGPFVFDRTNGLLWRDGREVPLPPRALGVLLRLIDRAGDVVSKTELLDHVWRDTFVSEVSLTEAISLLRQTLDDDPQRPTYIQTLPRRGYRFVARLDASSDPGQSRGVTDSAARSETETQATELGVWPAWLPWVFSGVLTIALVAVSVGLLRQPGLRERPVARFAIDTGPVALASGLGPALALSRDGARLVAVGDAGARGTRLYVRDLARVELTPLLGTDGARAPFFSPDGRWVGFFANGQLKKVPISGGDSVTLCEAPQAGGAAWTRQGSVVFAGGASGGLNLVGENGGRVDVLTVPDPALGEVRHLWPEAVASGRAVVFTGWPADAAPEAARIAVVSLDSKDVQTLVEGATFGRAVPTGHLLFLRDGVVLAAAFDGDALVMQGPAKPVLTTVAMDEGRGIAQFAVAASGALAQLTTSNGQEREAWRWAPGLARAAMPFEGRPVRSLAYETRHNLVATAIGDGHRADIWVDRVESTGVQSRVVRVTTSGHNARPVFARDGTAVVFASREEGPFNLFMALVGASAPAVRLTSLNRNQLPSSVSADGRLVYTQVDGASGLDIWAMPLGDGIDRSREGAATVTSTPPMPLVREPGDQTAGVISPDGRWLAYQSERRGRWRTRVRDLRASSATDVELGDSDGRLLAWERDLVLFVDDLARLRECRMGTPVTPDCATRVEDVAAFAGIRGDASGAALVRSAGVAAPPQLEIVLEWSKELSAKVPIRPKEVRSVR